MPCPTLSLSVRPCDTASPGSIPLSFAESFECGEAEKLKRAKDRWGIVPVDILEGQAPPMLTACVRETLKERKEAQSELKKELQDKGDGGIRLCETPSAIATASSAPGEGTRRYENTSSPILLFRTQLDAEEKESEFCLQPGGTRLVSTLPEVTFGELSSLH